MLSFVIAEEGLRIETPYPFNEVTAVFLLNIIPVIFMLCIICAVDSISAKAL